MLRAGRWRAHSLRRKSAASSPERLPPADAADWPRYLGRKISIRHRLHGDPDHEFSEAIGVVARVDEDSLSILNRKGETVVVAFADVIAGKVM